MLRKIDPYLAAESLGRACIRLLFMAGRAGGRSKSLEKWNRICADSFRCRIAFVLFSLYQLSTVDLCIESVNTDTG